MKVSVGLKADSRQCCFTRPGSALYGVRAGITRGLSQLGSATAPQVGPRPPRRSLLVHMPWCPLAPTGGSYRWCHHRTARCSL